MTHDHDYGFYIFMASGLTVLFQIGNNAKTMLDIIDDGKGLALDRCFVLRGGHDVTLVSWGAMIKDTLEAAEQLAGEGVDAEVIDIATLKPLEFATILDSVTRTGRLVIVQG